MTADQFRTIRTGLGLTQAQLAEVLGKEPGYISRMEQTGPWARAVPKTLAKLMLAYASGYRPDEWPSSISKAS